MIKEILLAVNCLAYSLPITVPITDDGGPGTITAIELVVVEPQGDLGGLRVFGDLAATEDTPDSDPHYLGTVGFYPQPRDPVRFVFPFFPSRSHSEGAAKTTTESLPKTITVVPWTLKNPDIPVGCINIVSAKFVRR